MSKPTEKTRLVALKAWLKFCKPYRYKIAFSALIFISSDILIAIIPVFIGNLVESLTNYSGETGQIWLWVIVLIACSTFHDLLWRGAEFSFRGLVNEINFLYETHLFKAVINKPYPYFVDKLTGKVGSYITTISSEFKGFLENVLFSFTGQVVSIVATILILGSLNWQTAAIYIAGLLGMVLVGRYTLANNMKDEALAADINSSKNGILYDAIANFANVKALRTESVEVQTIEREQEKTFQAHQKAFLTGIAFWGSMSLFVRHLMWPIIIILNVFLFLNGSLSVGQLATLLSTVLIFSSTIWESVWHVSQFGKKMARVDEAHLYLFGNTKMISTNHSESAKHPSFKKLFEINNLNFSYPDKQDVTVLENINLTLKAGEKIGIVGKSGSGKSTLTKLLLDFYPAPKGSLRLDGKDVSSQEFAQLVAFVPQDTALFHRSIADNISYGGIKNVDKKAIEKAAKLAEAHEFIKDLPDGYDTLIGERGVKLSGGQRQRVAIARAILRDAPVLILDEATSALDSESETLIQAALWKLMESRTAIVIAHRLSTIQKMDKIIVVDNGKIVEQGSHKDLLALNGIYAKLWSHQSGGFLED